MSLIEKYKHNTPARHPFDISDEEIWWDPEHPTYYAHVDRPNCTNCGKPCDMNNKYSSGQIKWRDMCYDCHDHRTDKNYLATKFVGKTLY